MSLNLEDINDNSLELNELEEEPKQGPRLNNKSSAVQAGVTVSLTGEGLEAYNETKRMVSEPETRKGVQTAQEEAHRAVVEQSKPALVDVLSETDIDDDIKVSLLDNINSGFVQNQSTLKSLATQFAVTDQGSDSTEAVEDQADQALDTLDEAIYYRRRMQNLVNGIKASREGSIGNTVKDIGELFVPFAEWIHYTDLQAELLPEDERAIFLGQQKQAIFEKLRGMPLADRAKIAESLASIIEENDQILLPDGNDLATIEALQNMLVSNEYQDWERWFDNVVTVADVVGLAGAIKWAVRSGKAPKAVKAASDAKAASEAEVVAEGDRFVSAADKARNSRGGSAREDVIIEGEFSEVTLSERYIENKTVTDDVDPATPGSIAHDTNPNIARGLQEAAESADGDEAALAIYGTNKSDAVVSNMGPKPDLGNGIPNKAEITAPKFGESEYIRKLRRREGNTLLSDSEWAKIESRLEMDFRNLEGMHLHEGSLLVKTDPASGYIGIKGRYSPVDSGFRTAEDALTNAEYAFRNYGLTKDDFTLLVRENGPDGATWVPESIEDAGAREVLLQSGADKSLNKQYAIGIEFDYSFRPEDIEVEELLTTKGLTGWGARSLDSTPLGKWLAKKGQGSVSQNLLDPASVIHPRIVNSASAVTDKAFRIRHVYHESVKPMAKKYAKLSKERKAVLADYIHEANLNEIPLNEADLLSRGFDKKEREILKDWRMSNDIMWYAANEDLVQTLRTQGYKALVHKDSDTLIIARPIKQPPRGELAYDPVKKSSVSIDEVKADLKEDQSFVEFAQAMEIDGEWVKYGIDWNTPHNGFTRALKDDETVLAYREGYYPVMYDANWFVDRVITLKGGTKTHKTIASAKNKKELAAFKDKVMRAENIDEKTFNQTYRVREDKKRKRAQNEMLDEGSFNLSSNSGLSMQRVRGERLADAGVNLHKMGSQNLMDPMESLAENIRVLSRRVAVRKTLETMKRRWLITYGDHLDLPLDKARNPLFPKSVDEVKGLQGADKVKVNDALVNFNYIYSFENGFINGFDEAYRGMMHWAAETVGDFMPGKVEELFFNAAKVSPTHAGKGLAFKLFLSSNPMRQALIQRTQISQFAVYNPTYLANPLGLTNDLTRLWSARTGMKVSKDTESLLQELKDLGIFQAVDAHTLIRDDFLKLANTTTSQKAAGMVGEPINWLQKIGFDFAEQDVLSSAYLVFRDLAIKNGEDISSVRTREKILGQARAAALNMNRSGDIAHGHNTLSPITQFLSFQHKMFVQAFTNKNLRFRDRLSLLAMNTLVFGVGSTPLFFAFDKIWGDEEPDPIKQFLKNGMLDTLANYGLSKLYGDEVAIDFSDMAPLEAYTMTDIFINLANSSVGEMLATSPMGSLFFGNNPRITELAATTARYFTPNDWSKNAYHHPDLEQKPQDVALAAAHLFSGFSAFFKARYAFEHGKAVSSSGRISDSEVNGVEAMAMVFGLVTKDMKAQWKIFAKSGYKPAEGKIDEDIRQWYKILKRHVARRGVESPAEIALEQAILSEAWRVFGADRPHADKIIREEIEKDRRAGDESMYIHLGRRSGLISHEDFMRVLNTLPDTKKRDELLKMYKLHREAIDENFKNLEKIKNGRVRE